MAKYTRVHHAPARPSALAVIFNYLSYAFLFAVCGVTLFLAWPTIRAQLTAPPATLPGALPTAQVARPQAAPAARPQAAPVNVPAQIDAYNATATAQYQDAIQRAPVPNVGQGAAVDLVSKPAERMPAGENVPTAEPIIQAESGGIFGSKPVLINPQETHECKHGQIWIEGKGCKNP